MKWERQTSPQLRAVDRRTPVVLNIAAIEQHGPHLPLATDALIGAHFIERIDAQLGEQVLMLPQISVCCSAHHMDFAGTLSVRHETLKAYVEEVLGAVAAHGFRNLVLFNSHGGNLAIGQVIVESFGARHPDVEIFLLTWWRIAGQELRAIRRSEFGGVGHACEFETSLMLEIAPDLVVRERIIDQAPVHAFEWTRADMLTAPRASHYRSMHELTSGCGVFGQPSLASAEQGRRISDAVTSQAVTMLRDIRSAQPR